MNKEKKRKKPVGYGTCGPLHRAYLDLSLDEDQKLDLIAALMLNQDGRKDIDMKTVIEIGYTIESYLQRKLVRESVFLGRTLRNCRLKETELKAELQRLRTYRKNI